MNIGADVFLTTHNYLGSVDDIGRDFFTVDPRVNGFYTTEVGGGASVREDVEQWCQLYTYRSRVWHNRKRSFIWIWCSNNLRRFNRNITNTNLA